MNYKNYLFLIFTATYALTGFAKPVHPWIVEGSKLSYAAYFTNLKDGDSITSPFVVKFGLSHWGLAPADVDLPNTGHHHLLVNTDLPVAMDKPIEFSDAYRHFDKGQMETVLNLKPGKHRLRLLLADHKHVPRLVYSKQITVNVTAQNADKLPASFNTEPNIQILGLTEGQTTSNLIQVLFHASNYNIAHANSKLKGTGHFVLTVESSAKRTIERFDFKEGQTDVWLNLPAGAASLKLELVDNATNTVLPIPAKTVNIISP